MDPVAMPQRVPLRVPWKTVVALAAGLSFADGFWLVSLRGAVGAIERAQSPFAGWLWESTVVLPVFALAVLGALTLALRWFGPLPRGPKQVVATALLIVGGGTVAGIAAVTASSAYDYHLQTAQLRLMDAMHAICTDSCLAQEQHATLAVHVHAVLYISRWLLLTNLVVVAWLVAMWGGRLRLGTTRAALDGPAGNASSIGGGRAQDLRVLLVGALVGSGAIHAAVVPTHLTEWPAAGMFFVLLAIWELALAALLLCRLDQRPVLLAAAAISIGPLLLWLYSRTAGLPFGPDAGQPEAVGLPDCLACALEVVSLLTAVALLRPAGPLGRRPRPSAHVRGLVVVSVIAAVAIGVAATGLGWFDAFGISGGPSVMNMGH
jgi:hypothetical protein